MVAPGCPACERVIEWFKTAANFFPDVRFIFVARRGTAELKRLAGEFRVLLDQDGFLGALLEVKRAPTVLLRLQGVEVTRLDWPFSKDKLLQELEEFLSFEIVFHNPRDLLGQPAPDFALVDQQGAEVSLAHLPCPLLLVFFNPGCPLCWQALPIVKEISEEVPVVLLVFVGEGVARADLGRLEEFWQGLEGRPVKVLLINNSKVLQDYKVVTSPTYTLVNRKGVIVRVWEGEVGAEELRENVRGAL